MELIYLKVLLYAVGLNTFIWFFLKKKGYKFNYLSCGISAYVGAKPADANLIKIIMMFNESRGEDGTGWAVNDIVEKDTEKVTKFIQTHTLDITPEDDNFTIVAHARKSSSGTKHNKELVHPFSIYADEVEKEKPDLILVMNGTLTNTQLMANTFNVPYKEHINSDTQMLARAMAKLGEKNYMKAIEGYEGTATLVFFTPKQPNTLMVYRDPQRPIYYWQKEEDEMYISSMDEPLLSIGAKKNEICLFESEVLYKIVKGKIKSKKKIDRKPLKYKSIYESNGSRNHMYHSSSYEYNNKCSVPYVDVRNSNRELRNLHAGKGNNVYCIQDKYYRNGHLCTDMLCINSKGQVYKEGLKEGFENYYFISGYLCKDEQSYDRVIEKCSDKKGFNIRIFKSMLLSSFVDYFKYPITSIVNEKERWILNSEYSEKCQTIGSKVDIDMFLSNNIVTVRYDGEFTATTLKDVANVVVVKEKQVTVKFSDNNLSNKTIEQINEDINKTQQNIGIIKIIKEDVRKTFRSNYYYMLARTDIYKCNPSPEVKNHFYQTLLEELKNFDLLSEEGYNNLFKEGSKCNFEKFELVKEIDIYMELFHKKLNNSSSKKEIDNLSTIEKFKLIEKENNEFSQEEIIESIKSSNELLKDNKFSNDLLDYTDETFSQFTTRWVPVDTSERMIPFLEAICLCLNKIGFISYDELQKILNNNYIILLRKVEDLWDKWKDQFKEYSIKAVEDAQKIIDNKIIEQLESDSFEKECKDEINNIIDSMKSYIQQVEVTDDTLKTQWINKSINIIESSINYINRYLVKNEKQENEAK